MKSTITASFRNQIQEQFEYVYFEETSTTPGITVYTGPRVLGICYAAGDWPV